MLKVIVLGLLNNQRQEQVSQKKKKNIKHKTKKKNLTSQNFTVRRCAHLVLTFICEVEYQSEFWESKTLKVENALECEHDDK